MVERQHHTWHRATMQGRFEPMRGIDRAQRDTYREHYKSHGSQDTALIKWCMIGRYKLSTSAYPPVIGWYNTQRHLATPLITPATPQYSQCSVQRPIQPVFLVARRLRVGRVRLEHVNSHSESSQPSGSGGWATARRRHPASHRQPGRASSILFTYRLPYAPPR